MIFDNIARKALTADPRMAVVADTIRRLLAERPCPGHYQIDGERFYYNVMQYDAELRQLKCFENHHRYIDVHVVLDGKEYTDVIALGDAVSRGEYDEAGDCEFFDCDGSFTSVLLRPGDYLSLAPGELHRPGVAVAEGDGHGKSPVLKVVFKLALD